MRHDVLLVALENRFGVARFPLILNKAGCRIAVLGRADGMVCSSRFIDRVIPCAYDPNAVADALRRELAGTAHKPWVIFTDEFSLDAAAACRGESWLKDIFPVDPQSPKLEIVMRKTAFMQTALKAGLPIPRMRVCATLAEAHDAGNDVGYPLFMKRQLDCAGAGVIQVMRDEDLPEAFYSLSQGRAVLIQQMIHGKLAKANMLMNRGQAMCWTSAYALQTWPGKFGPSCVREHLVDPQIDAIVGQLAEMTGFHGLCGFDAIRDEKTGKFIVIEFNGRLTPHYHLGWETGVDYARAISDFLEDRMSLQRPWLRLGEQRVIYVFPQHLRKCISEGDWKGLLKWLPGMSRKDIPWGDANLVVQFVLGLIALLMKRIVYKLRPRKGSVSARKAGKAQVGMSYDQIIENLGAPVHGSSAEFPFIRYRVKDGRDMLIGFSAESSQMVATIKFKKQGEIITQ
jgi:predicted ATP-grasp superfamily ATP-dependent carboligase